MIIPLPQAKTNTKKIAGRSDQLLHEDCYDATGRLSLRGATETTRVHHRARSPPLPRPVTLASMHEATGGVPKLVVDRPQVQEDTVPHTVLGGQRP